MNKIVPLSAIMTGMIVLAAGMTGSASDEPNAANEKATKSCCNAAAGCCLAGSEEKCEADAKVAAKDEKEKGASCKLCSDKECKEECSECAKLSAATQASSDASAAKTGVDVAAARGPGKGMGRGRGFGPGPGHAHAGDSQHDIDHQDFFFLIDHKETIKRTVKNLPNGIETLTESANADVAARIQKHVAAMYDRVENVNPIRMRDPLFREIFANAKKIKMEFKQTDNGVLVTETSEDPYVAKLLQKHAVVVSKFIKNGYAELPKNHQPPKR